MGNTLASGKILFVLSLKVVNCPICKTSIPGVLAVIMISAHGCLNKLSIIPGVFTNRRLPGEQA